MASASGATGFPGIFARHSGFHCLLRTISRDGSFSLKGTMFVARSRMRRASYLILAAASLIVATGTVAAKEPRRHFDIPAQDGASALNAFSTQSGLSILYPYRLAAAKRVRPINGDLPALAALRQLLEDTGLQVMRQRNGIITLGQGNPATAS